jgi:hypothetical protein
MLESHEDHAEEEGHLVGPQADHRHQGAVDPEADYPVFAEFERFYAKETSDGDKSKGRGVQVLKITDRALFFCGTDPKILCELLQILVNFPCDTNFLINFSLYDFICDIYGNIFLFYEFF